MSGWRRGLSPTSVVLLGAAVGGLVLVVATRADVGDVAVYRHGAELARHDRIYSFRDAGGHGFTYPPFAALAMAPLALLPLRAMWAVLVGLSTISLAVVVHLSDPALVRRAASAPGAAALVAAIVLVEPVTATLRFGQVDLVLAMLVLADALVWRTGVMLGLAVAIKLTPAIFVVHLVGVGRRREAVTALRTFLLTVITGLVWAPASSARFWCHEVWSGSGVNGFDHAGNQSVRGLCERLFGQSAGSEVWLLAVVPVFACGLRIARRRALAGDEPLALGVVGVTGCLVSPIAWTHHWVWAVPVVLGLLAATHRGRPGRILVWSVLADLLVWSALPARLEGAPGVRVLGTGYAALALCAGLGCYPTWLMRTWLPAGSRNAQSRTP